MSNYVIPVFPAASRVPPRDALAARLAELTGRFAELSSELAAISSAVASVSGKADKAPPAAPGSLASLDASGNLADSGATPASIKAAAVAEVVANAPGTMDTLKEIADILGSTQQTGTVLKRISDLETGKADSSSLARVATSGSYDDLSGKPAIPAPVAVDATLSTQGAAADAKAVGDALRSEFTEWVFSGDGYDAGHTYTVVIDPSEEGGDYDYMLYDNGTYVDLVTVATDSVLVVSFSTDITATRHFATPTKTSQLTNDGAPGGGGTPYATTGQIPSASTATPQMDGTASPGGSAAYSRGDHVHPSDTGKFDGAAAYPAWSAGVYSVGTVRSYNGRLYKVASQVVNQSVPPDSAPWWEETTIAELKQDALSQSQLAAVNSGATSAKVTTWDGYAAQIAQKANATDLPYRLVEPGKWELSDGGSHTINGPNEDPDGWYYQDSVTNYYSQFFDTEADAIAALVLTFSDGLTTVFTATRPSLPGHLCDRAGNRVVVSGDTTLTLPAAVPGYARDFLVRLEISGSTVPTITFAAPTGEAITYETDGDEFPVPDEAGNWSYSFTENCVANTFAVALKKVNTVAQGGS